MVLGLAVSATGLSAWAEGEPERSETPEVPVPQQPQPVGAPVWTGLRRGMVIPVMGERGLEMWQVVAEVPKANPNDPNRYFDVVSDPNWREAAETGSNENNTYDWMLTNQGRAYRLALFPHGRIDIFDPRAENVASTQRTLFARAIQGRQATLGKPTGEVGVWNQVLNYQLRGETHPEAWILSYRNMAQFERAASENGRGFSFMVLLPNLGPIRWVTLGPKSQVLELNHGVLDPIEALPDTWNESLAGNIRVLKRRPEADQERLWTPEEELRLQEIAEMEEALVRNLKVQFEARRAGEEGRNGFRPNSEKERGEAHGEGEEGGRKEGEGGPRR